MNLMSKCLQMMVPALILGFSLQANAETRQLSQSDLAADGEPVVLAAEGCNRAFHFSVNRAELRDVHAGHAAPPGQHWLVLDLAVENRMPVDLLYDLDYREDLLVASLSRQFYLLVNGRQVARRTLFENDEASAMPNDFILSYWGDRVEGRVVYPVPEAGVETLSLHYYHDQYTPAVVALLGEVVDETTQSPSQPVQTNDLMEIGVFGVEIASVWNGKEAADGMSWLAVDLRGRGHWSIDADALALDRQASPGERVRLPKVMEYVQAGGLLQVVADGENAYIRSDGLSTLSDEPPFLPDAMAGGRAVFQVPENADSLMLEVHFPEFRGPGIDEPIPDSMIFALRGDTVQPEHDDPLDRIEDEPTPLTLHGFKRVREFSEHRALTGESLLVLDASMRNTSPVGGMMKISDRIDLFTRDGARIELLGIYNRGPMKLSEPFWLPVGGSPRRFNLIYRLPIDAEVAELAYRGVSINTSLKLHDDPAETGIRLPVGQ